MLNKDQKKKRQIQIEAHRLRRIKSHQYPIRLSLEQYSRLKKMSGNGPMSDVINRGIDVEWEFYTTVQKWTDKLPQFNSLEDLQNWRLEQFKNSPELLSKYVIPTTIASYAQEMELDRKAQLEMNRYLETINYSINQIGGNINQLARRANSGGEVSKSELRNYTKEVIQLRNVIGEVFKKKISQ